MGAVNMLSLKLRLTTRNGIFFKKTKQFIAAVFIFYFGSASVIAETWLCKGSIYTAPFYYIEVANIDFKKELWSSRKGFGCSAQEIEEFYGNLINECISTYQKAIKINSSSPIDKATGKLSGNKENNTGFFGNLMYHPVRKTSEDSVYLRFEIINRDGSASETQIITKNIEKQGLSGNYTQTFGQVTYRPHYTCRLIK